MSEENKNQMYTDIVEFYEEHTNMDFPVGIYYVELQKMYMECVRWQWHNELEIDYVRSGEAIFEIGEETVRVSAGSAVLVNGNHIHSIHSEQPEKCVILSILFHPDFIFDSSESFLSLKYKEPILTNPDFKFVTFTPASPWGKRGIECINAIINTNLHKNHGYELLTRSYLCNLWIQLLEKDAQEMQTKTASVLSVLDEDRVKQAILYIHANYAKPLTLDDIAESIHVSKSECCRCFKRSMRLTPFEYLMKHRIFESARKMQRNEQAADSISSLASSVGFNNSSYYNKIFRKYLHCTPTEYREEIKKNHRDALSPFGISLARM